jgi:hypothetical protein
MAPSERKSSEFERAGADGHNESLISEFIGFLHENRKWWLLPIVIITLLLSVLIVLVNSPAAPFIYTLF